MAPEPAEVPIRPAATVAILREGAAGLETLMVLRPVEAEFAPRAQVFPGGRIDDADADARWAELVRLEDSDTLGLPTEDGHPPPLALLVGALREVFEETAILLGVGPEQFPGVDWAASARARLAASEASFGDVIVEAGLHLAPSPVAYFARWITPLGMPRRYDTRFFAAAMSSGQDAVAAAGEIQSLEWISPAAALARADTNDAYTLPPTRAVLSMLSKYGGLDEAFAALPGDRDLSPILPRIVSVPGGTGLAGVKVLMPGDPGYED